MEPKATTSEVKKPVWITTQARDSLREYCDRTGRTQVDVVSELLQRFLKPRVDSATKAK